MLFDYIYLILIILLICLILFLIYLSYEYKIEGFELSNLSNYTYDENIIKNLETKLLNDYKKYYTDVYNQEINNLDKKNLDIYDKSKTNLDVLKKLEKMKFNLKPLPKVFPADKTIKTIKSKYNSQNLSTFTNDINKYGILANDKCLTVKGLCEGEFCLLDCQNKLYSGSSQKFTTDRINSAVDAAKIMNVNISKINSSNIYPFNIFRSTVNNNCLTINDDGLTVETCNLNNKKQQWEISPDENICYLS